MCLAKDPIENIGHNMNLEPIKKSLEKTRFVFKPRVKITGGEPMLHRQFGEFVTYLKARGHNVSINSNGFLLDKFSTTLVESKLNYLNITILGEGNLYEEVSQVQDSYERVVNNIKELTEIKQQTNSKYPKILVNIPVNQLNQDKLVDTVRSLQGLPIQRITIQNLGFFNEIDKLVGFESASGVTDNTAASINVEQLKEEYREIKSLKSKVPIQFFPEIPEKHRTGYYRDTEYQFPQESCIQPWLMLSVSADLTVEPCLYHKTKLGKIDNDGSNLVAIWRNQRSAEFRMLIRNKGATIDGCKRCCLRKY